MTVTAIREFPDGHFEEDITSADGSVKTVGITAPPKSVEKKTHITAQLQLLKTASNEAGPVDITAAIGSIVLK